MTVIRFILRNKNSTNNLKLYIEEETKGGEYLKIQNHMQTFKKKTQENGKVQSKHIVYMQGGRRFKVEGLCP